MPFRIIYRDPNGTVWAKKMAEQFQPVTDQTKPDRMLNPVIVMHKRTTSVVWRINKYTFDLPRKLLLKRLESEKIVAKDEAVIENVLIRHTMFRMM